MKIYLVGGAVRDQLMGLEPKDKDYVVVGSTPDEMLNLGYKQVGAEFPVFLHPDTGDEYALARTEYKDGQGYQGFKCTFGPDVTLEEDLARRDLTINAIAQDIITGEIFDPFSGQKDIEAKLLRPTTKAFAEDPVRVLRAARFLARYPDFSTHISMDLMKRQMIASGELEHLVPERVWLELRKTLTEQKPSRFFDFLDGTGIFPEIEAFVGIEEKNRWHPEFDVYEHIMLALDYSVRFEDPITSFGVLCHDLGKPEAYAATGGLKSTKHESLGVPIAEAFCDRLKAPADYKYMAMKSAEFHTHIHLAFDMKPKTIMKLFEKFRNKVWFDRLLDVATADKRGRGKPACDWVYTQPSYLHRCWDAAYRFTDTKAISSSMKPGPAVGEAIRRARVASISRIAKDYWQKQYDDCHAKVIAEWEAINENS
ncbi:tRNA nucleotidyltransferase [Vibrio phage D69]